LLRPAPPAPDERRAQGRHDGDLGLQPQNADHVSSAWEKSILAGPIAWYFPFESLVPSKSAKEPLLMMTGYRLDAAHVV